MTSSLTLLHTWRFLGFCGVLTLCALCLLPPPPLMVDGPPFSDKLYHLAAYAGLTWWHAMGYPRARWRLIAALLALLGIVLELLQGLTPLRMASGWDEVANVSGIGCGYWLATRMPPGFPAFRQAK